MVKFVASEMAENNELGVSIPVTGGVLTIPEGETEIARGAYMDHQEIRKVILPETLKWIGDTAFAGCENLCEITIPASVEKIDYQAFKGCENLREISYAGNEEQFEALEWMEKSNYLTEEPDEDWKEFSYWIKFIG